MSGPLLAVDPGTHTGIAYRRADGTKTWRTWELVGAGGVRLNKLEDRLRALHEREGFVRVSYEGVYHGPNSIAVGVLRHFEAIILNWTARVGLPCWAYSASEIKRAVATGRADKRQMIERVRWLGFNVANDHEADAVAQLLLLERGIAPSEPTRKAAARERKRAVDLFTAVRMSRRRVGAA